MAKTTKQTDDETAAEAQTTALSKTEQKQLIKAADERWKSATEDLRTRRRQAAADIIQYRFDVGKFAVDLMEDRAKELGSKLYGDRTVEQLCEALAESSSTVHTCIKFARRCDQKELDYFKKHEWPWRAISSIVTVDDAKEYKRLKDDFEQERFKTSDELKTAVKEVNLKSKETGVKKDKRGGSTTMKSTIKAFNTSCGMLATKLTPNFMEALKRFEKDAPGMDAESSEEVAKSLAESKESVSNLSAMLTRTNELLGEIDI